MMVSNRGSVLRLIAWQWKSVIIFIAAATATAVIHKYVSPSARLPALPLGVVGGALGIFVSFRTNSAYARWWEGRQLWGRLINASRTFCSQALTYLPSTDEGRALATKVVKRHIAYVHVLRVALRGQDLKADAEVTALVRDEERALLSESNPNHGLCHLNYADIAAAQKAGMIDTNQLLAFDDSLRAFIDVQGGCERIKKTPLPRGYAFIAERLILAFGFLFPLATVAELGWWVIPVSTFVCLAFALISEAGRVLEDPFTMFWNGLPLTAMSKTIEVNLRERLGEKDLPKIPVANADGILM
jgi:putative membrane protein